MRARTVFVTLVALVCALLPAAAGAQPGPPPAPPQPGDPTPSALMVDVTVARYLGEKRLSSTPYTLSVLPGERAAVRMGGDVPVPATTFTPAQKEGDKPVVGTSYSYRGVGTNIDVMCNKVEGTGAARQYRIVLTIDENSIYADDVAPALSKTTGAPAFRSFKSTNTFSLRDGQSVEYAAATDRLSGEVYRVTIKMTVVK
jgi:hypothetical protein